MLLLLVAAIVFTSTGALSGQAESSPLTTITVTINPEKVTIYAGEVQPFAATVTGTDEQSVSWAVEEEAGGNITDSGLYIAPKVQGVYHITAASRRNPQKKAIATITVLAYCDPLPPAFRP